jgi:hypothetical protein
MFHSQKSFEKSLRSSTACTYQVPIITPLKTEIHKGCTGKAHACGSIKSVNTVLANKPTTTQVKAKAKNENKVLRKNSLSSETVSDSGSDSWNSNKDNNNLSTLTNNNHVNLPLIKPLKRAQSVSSGSHHNSNNNNNATAKRRTSDSVISTDCVDNARSPINKVHQQRGRLMSDGDGKANVADSSNDDIMRLRRSSSFRTKNVPPLIPLKPKNSTQQNSNSTIINNKQLQQQNGNFNNGRLRTSFRALKNQNQQTNWNTLWENSFATKLGGGNLRILDKSILQKSEVNFN